MHRMTFVYAPGQWRVAADGEVFLRLPDGQGERSLGIVFAANVAYDESKQLRVEFEAPCKAR